MFNKLLLIGILMIGAVAILGAEARAITLPGGYTFTTKGVRCEFKGAGIQTDDLCVTAGECDVSSIVGAIIFCTNNPNKGFPQGSAHVEVVDDFVPGVQLTTSKSCDRKGNCKFNVVANTPELGGPCPFKPQQWTILDIVPISFHFDLKLVQCYDVSNNLVACDGTEGEVVSIVTVDQQSGQCSLPDPAAFKFGDSTPYSCSAN